jgi:enediyne biosynthesis protein E4
VIPRVDAPKPSRAHWTVALLLLPLIFTGLSGCPPSSTTQTAVAPAPPPTLPSEPGGALFRDVTDSAGLAFKQSDGGCGLVYFPEQVAAGAAILDANGDGNLDIYFPAPKPLGACIGKTKGDIRQRLYLGDGHGHFRLSPNAFHGVETDYGIGAAVGDYDNDGRPDLYVCCYGKNKLFHNNGDGTFTDVTKKAGLEVGGFSTAAVWFDYDGDGKLDLYVMRYCEWSVAKDIVCYGPNNARDSCNPHNYVAATNKLFHNNGDGTFTDVTAKSGAAPDRRRSLSGAAVDYDGDGRLDLFVANDLGLNYLLHNNGDGTFNDVAVQENVAFGASGNLQANMGIAAGDYNDTGRMSLLVTTFANEPKTLYRNDGPLFTDQSEAAGIAAATRSYLSFGTGFIDTRNCGRLDLFCANGHISYFAYVNDPQQTFKQRNQLLLNDGKGNFVEAKTALPSNDVRVHRGAAFGDFDNDGRVDILVTASDDRPTLLHNESKAGNWLLLKLINRYGCATPIGTRCTATVNGRKLLRAVIGGGSYGGDSDYRVHFGLGNATQADQIEIRWMSGKVQILKDVSPNQILTVKEPRE